MVLNVGSYQLKSSRLLVLCRAAGDFIYIFHYLLLGSPNGCVTVGICSLNGVICGFRGSAWAEWKGWKWLLSIVLTVSCLLMWRHDFQPLPPHMQPDLHFDDDLGDMVGQRQGDPAGPPVPGWAGMDYLLRSGWVDPGRTDRIDRHGVGCGLDLPLRAAQPG